ncbi:hypothetical protein GCM10011351_25570 [Paraliobacillus quinghaiensis]|uniref:Spore coat protein n=1 Tax=Paraliobacillus quinghaiensis TaxID=470815 RepID=A0A917WXF2_9BACI|nr:hypothetical protein [Paraliobacillus quinghaiensis]GGM38319.1 hypothetical protein GCM10011351_25570 [Paraliobacillus quinghaiensis]
MNTNYYDENYYVYNSTDERFLPGLVGFGFPFLTGLAAGAILAPRPRYPYPYPYPYPPYPYPPHPYYCC